MFVWNVAYYCLSQNGETPDPVYNDDDDDDDDDIKMISKAMITTIIKTNNDYKVISSIH